MRPPGDEPPKAENPGRSPRGAAVGPRAGGAAAGPPDALPAARPSLTCRRPLGLQRRPPAAVPSARETAQEAGRGGQDAPGRRLCACVRRSRACPVRGLEAHLSQPEAEARGFQFAARGGAWAPRLNRTGDWSWAARSPVPGNGEENCADVRGRKQTCGRGAAGSAVRLFILGHSALEMLSC